MAAVVIDAHEGVTSQDMHILGMALDEGAGLIIVMNKLDLVEADPVCAAAASGSWRGVPASPAGRPSSGSPPWKGAASTPLSRLRCMSPTNAAAASPPRASTRCCAAPSSTAPPSTYRGRPIRFYYATQTEIEPPTFVFFCNYPEGVHFSYERYLLGQIRRTFGFDGAALRCVLRGREPKAGA